MIATSKRVKALEELVEALGRELSDLQSRHSRTSGRVTELEMGPEDRLIQKHRAFGVNYSMGPDVMLLEHKTAPRVSWGSPHGTITFEAQRVCYLAMLRAADERGVRKLNPGVRVGYRPGERPFKGVMWYGVVIPRPAGSPTIGKTGVRFIHVMRDGDAEVRSCYPQNLVICHKG